MPRTASANSNSSGAVVLDKSLPALPPHAISASAFPPDSDNVTLAGSLAEPSPSTPAHQDSQKGEEAPSNVASVGMSLIRVAENVTLSSAVYTAPTMATPTVDDGFSFPVALDNREDPAMLSSNRNQAATAEYLPTKHSSVSAIMRDDYQDLVAGSSRSASTDGNRPKRTSPALPAQHIASLQRGRQSSSEMVDTMRQRQSNEATSTTTSPTVALFDRTRLSPSYEPQDPLDRIGQRGQEVPRSRVSLGAESRHTSLSAIQNTGSPTSSTTNGTFEDSVTSELRRRGSFKRSPLASPILQGSAFDRPARDDSLGKIISRKEVPNSNGDTAQPLQERKGSVSALQRKDSVAKGTISRPIASSVSGTLTADGLPIRSPRRPGSARPDEEREFVAPRNAPPPPPIDMKHRQNASISSIQSEHFSTGELTPTAEDVNDEDGHGGLFRKVSKAVRHGRSHSDKIGALPSPRWRRNGSTEISSPILASPNTAEETIQLRNKLRFAQQRVTELEAEKNALEERVNGTVDLRQMNTELREKRSTMAFLDTQREMVIRELEVMTDHMSKAKDSNRGINVETLQQEVLRDFAASLSRLKDQMSVQIEELVQRKNDVTTQISSLIQMKDKGFQEYEALSTKNAQLTEVNNQLIQNIQDMYKQSRQPGGPVPPLPVQHIQTSTLPPNGLGIYTQQSHKDSMASDAKSISIADTNYSGETQVEAGTMLDAPQVVNIRKGQPKKFNWKKGGASVAKNVSKGLKGAFSSTAQHPNSRDEHFLEGAPYGSIAPGEMPTVGNAPYRAGATNNTNNPGWSNFLTAQRPTGPGAKPSSRDGTPTNASAITVALAPSGLPADTSVFGSDLSARCDFEKRIIPTLVQRCIAEVETRGMNAEGIYRKSGSSSQIKSIQAGFERDCDHFDIADPDLDVHAVTSALKQYFRRLPNPLITFEAYDALLEAVGGPDAAKEVQGAGDEAMARRIAKVVEGVLPNSHRETLAFLMDHLGRVMEMEGENLVSSASNGFVDPGVRD